MAKIKKILVPTDFSKNASCAYEYAVETADNYDARIDLIHIIPKMAYFNLSPKGFSKTFRNRQEYEAFKNELLRELQEEMQNNIPEAQRGEVFVKREDRAASGIAKHAFEEDYDLIIVANRGRGNSTFTRGGVTERLIRVSKTPLLSMTRDYNPEIETLVMPTDGSAVSLEALPMAYLVAAQNKASIRLLSISKFDVAQTQLKGTSAYGYTEQKIREDVRGGLREFVARDSNQLTFVGGDDFKDDKIRIKNKSGVIVELDIVIQKGISAHAGIVQYAIENAQLVVMATHGRSALANLLVGSNAEKVARYLKMPVLTIRPSKFKN